MYASAIQIQSPDDEDEDQADEENDVVRSCKKSVQESFLTHNFGQSQDFTVNQKCIDFACPDSVSNPLKISYERLIQEGFDLASSEKTKARRRKSAAADGGGRVIRAAGRKDRHSKVSTARGPRDRRLRLSPATAIQFYDVQDRLGCDRPSKAIDWLIKEAKAAIDALDEQQIINFSGPNAAAEEEAENRGGFSLSQRGMRGKEEQHLNDDGLVPGFSCFAHEAAPPPPAAAYGFCSASDSTPQSLEMYTWSFVNATGGGGADYSSGNSLPPQAAAQLNSGPSNLFREPLQSSSINYSWMNNDFAGFNFSNELSKIAASATPKTG